VHPFSISGQLQTTPETMDRLKSLLEIFAEYPKPSSCGTYPGEMCCQRFRNSTAAPAFIDEPKFKDSIRQDLEVAPGRLLYLRFHGRKFEKWWRHEHRNERYDYLYKAEELEPYAVRLKSILETRIFSAPTSSSTIIPARGRCQRRDAESAVGYPGEDGVAGEVCGKVSGGGNTRAKARDYIWGNLNLQCSRGL